VIRSTLKKGLGKARNVAKMARGFVSGPLGPGYGVGEYEDIERMRREAAAQDELEGVATSDGEHEAIEGGTVEISAEDLRVMLEVELPEDQPLLVDVREAHEWDEGHIEGAVHFPLSLLEAATDDFDPNREIVVYCAGGARSIDGSYVLKRAGLSKVRSLAGGLAAWRGAGNDLIVS